MVEMNVTQTIELAVVIFQMLDAHAEKLWPGFTPFPFILYDNENRVAVGEGWQKEYKMVTEGVWEAEGPDPQLMGCTIIIQGNRPVAIWDTRMWPDEPDIAEAASGMAHETFHSFQLTCLNIPWPNELLPPQYPHSPYSTALVIEENNVMAGMIKNPDIDSLHAGLEKIAGLRKQRENEIGAEFFEYDKRIESMEGTAMYIQFHMKAILENTTVFETAESYIKMLAQEGNFLAGYRQRCYMAGAFICLAADVLIPDWKSEWPCSEIPIYDWVAEKMTLTGTRISLHESVINEAELMVAAYRQQNESSIVDFMAQPLAEIEGSVRLLFFDPMNIVCSNGRALHKTGRLNINGREFLLEFPFLTEYGNTIMDIQRIWIPKKREQEINVVHH
jgi:hypothetical protein